MQSCHDLFMNFRWSRVRLDFNQVGHAGDTEKPTAIVLGGVFLEMPVHITAEGYVSLFDLYLYHVFWNGNVPRETAQYSLSNLIVGSLHVGWKPDLDFLGYGLEPFTRLVAASAARFWA